MAQADSGFVVVKDAVEQAGCVTYWRASGSVSIEALTAAWKAAGLDEKLLREPPEAVTALRRAVMEQQDRHVLVRSLKKGEWAIVDEIVQDVAEGQPAVPPTYSTAVIVRFHEVNGFQTEAVYGGGARTLEVSNAIRAAFNRQQGSFEPEDITGWLVKLAKAQNSVTLRDSGGVYFIPQPAMEFWHKAADVIESVSAHAVFRIPAMKSAEAVAAITDAVNAEAKQIAKAMDDDLALEGDDALGARALKSRAEAAQKLLDKINSYEKLLGTQMEIRQRIEDLSANLAVAAMSAPEKAA